MSADIIWFQHLHKCAGSTIIAGAKINGLTLYPQHANGNPQDADGNDLKLWTYSPEELLEFLDQIREMSVNFIATEWGGACYDTLDARKDVRLVTVIRDPLERFMSNYFYDISAGFSRTANIESYTNSAGNWTRHNYYTRIFARYEGEEDAGQEHLDEAMRSLRLFNHVFVQDDGLNQKVSRELQWSELKQRRNRTPKRINPRMIFWSLLKRNFRGVTSSLLASRRVSDVFKQEYRRKNALDYQLFALAKELETRG